MDPMTLSYIAGALDADGCLSIRRSTYHMRVRGDAVNATYHESITLKQVTPQVPELLKATFGGSARLEKPSTRQGRPLYAWGITDANAARAAAAIRPYLRIKQAQCDAILELGHWRRHPDAHRFCWWWEQDNPEWRDMPMLTAREVCARLGYAHPNTAAQALQNRTLVALPYDHRGKESARYPAPLIDAVAAQRRDALGRMTTPPQIIAIYERLWGRVAELNKIGVNGTAINRREGAHAPLA